MVKYNSVADNDARLDKLFGALADSTRRAILAQLASGPAQVTDLAAPFDMSLPAVSKHLKVLERAGLLARDRQGRVHRCRLQTGGLDDVEHWIEQTKAFWEARFDNLERHLNQATEDNHGRKPVREED